MSRRGSAPRRLRRSAGSAPPNRSTRRKLAGTATLDDVLWATAYQTALMLKVRVVLLLPEDGVLTVKSGYPPEDELDRADLAAANWTWSNDRPAGRGSDTLPGAKRLFLPMRTGRGLIGVIGTLVDCVERPDLAAGTEELSNALQTVRALDVTKLVELTTARENQSLAGILGCWLESRREDLFVDDEMLKDLKRSAPSSPRAVLGTTSQAGEAHPEWNVVLPSEFLHPSFEGGSPEMAP